MTDGSRTVAVIGGGSAGFTAARTAARGGARVLFFMGNNADMASLCVNRGCMPSKALFEPIDALHHARGIRGVRAEPVDAARFLGDVVAWKDREIARFRAFRQRAIRAKDSDRFRVIRGDARFLDPNTAECLGERYTFDSAIIATGSSPRRPPIPGLDGLRDDIWTSEDILGNRVLPESLIVIGAGAIGLEFALRYARLGCAVTIIARSRMLSSFPERFGDRLAHAYEDDGIRVMRNTAVLEIRRDVEGMFVVETEGPERAEPVTGTRILMAVGREPLTDSLGLGPAGIATDERGRLDVGDDMRVRGHDHLFAAGDVLGHRIVVHQAHIEGGIAAENAADGGGRVWDKRSNVQVVFSDPEFAFAGITAEQAEATGLAPVTASKESRLVGKLHLASDRFGFGEFVADSASHRLLGAGLLCKGAADMIHLPSYLIDHGHTVHQGAMAEYYHPTRIEIVSGIFDTLCRRLEGHPFQRADERTG